MNPATASPAGRPASPVDERSFGHAWLAMTAALALHISDEASHDFLSVYNPAVVALRERLSWLWLPTFTFATWMAGLILGLLALLALAPTAFRGRTWLRRLAWPFAILMFGNGLGHLLGSLWWGRLLPGIYSSPFLLAAAAYLFVSAWRGRPHGRNTPPVFSPAS
ncbi:MAG TPA: hypothetical protein VG734_25005 [Lacunisphaera sp.]|nr:hypothetical protein [Lacunisphaera sp.]